MTDEPDTAGDATYRVTAGELRQFCETIERWHSEKADAAEGEREAYAAAKSAGYDTKILRRVIADRKKDRDALSEERAVQEMYEKALEGK